MEPIAKRSVSAESTEEGENIAALQPPDSCVFRLLPPKDGRTERDGAGEVTQSALAAQGGLSEAALAHYVKHGFIVLRGLLSVDEAQEVRKQMHRVIDEWYDEFEKTGVEKEDWVSMVNREQSARDGKMAVRTQGQRYLSVRRLFRMAVHDEYFRRIACESGSLESVTEQLLGKDVKLLQSMALLKPPGASEKRWHQDNGYFRLTPNHVMAFWIAIDESTVENGCMHVVPGTHVHGVDEHKSPNGNHTLYSLTKLPDEEMIIPIPLQPGDALVFHGELHHFTPPNKSNGPRYALQLHYASARCRPTVCPKNGDEPTAPANGDPSPGSGLEPAGSSSHTGEQEEQAAASSDGSSDTGAATGAGTDGGFDCDPTVKCVEPQFWYFRKAERLVLGEDYGDPYI